MLGAIKYNLKHLLDFSGRDARQTFWYYILFLVVLQFLVGMIAIIPSMVTIMGDTFTAAISASISSSLAPLLAAVKVSPMMVTMEGMMAIMPTRNCSTTKNRM